MREWIQDASEAERVYLVRFTREGSHHGWQYADASGVIDILSDQAYASFIDEEADDIAVSILTEVGALPVVVKLERDEANGLIGVTMSYRDPFKRGRASYVVADSGAYKILGA